jgi:hypothetical protein
MLTRLVFVVLSLFCIFCLDFVSAGSRAKAVAILKLPRSGSSWFVSLLSQQPGVWMVPQVLRPSDDDDNKNGTETAKESDAHDIEMLMSALSQPFKARDDPLAANAEQRVIGFSLNPLKFANESRFDNGKALRNAVSKRDAYVVLFERTNLVKQALATMRGSCLKAQCHFNNVLVNQSKWPKSHVLLNGLNSDKDFQSCKIAAQQHACRCATSSARSYWHSLARDTLRTLHSLDRRRDERPHLRRVRGAAAATPRASSSASFKPTSSVRSTNRSQLEQYFSKTTGENLKEIDRPTTARCFKLFEEARSACLLEMLQVDHARVFNTTDCVIPKLVGQSHAKDWIDRPPKPLIARQMCSSLTALSFLQIDDNRITHRIERSLHSTALRAQFQAPAAVQPKDESAAANHAAAAPRRC